MKVRPVPGHNKRQATRAVVPSMAKILKSPRIRFTRKIILPSFTTRGLAHVDRDPFRKMEWKKYVEMGFCGGDRWTGGRTPKGTVSDTNRCLPLRWVG